MQKLASVLLVDDNSTSNFLHGLLLSQLQVTDCIEVAENGAEALALLVRTYAAPPGTPYPALILLDVNMPVMDGVAFLGAYQQLPPAQQQASVIVLLTTTVHEGELQRLGQLPIAGLITKPLTKGKIHDLLQAYFQEPLPALE